MTVNFYKYQGTGNDFIIIDNRTIHVTKNNTKTIKRLCNRRFGIGADGLILLENSEVAAEDFKMVYYNSDGNQSSMCGNGGRCLVDFAKYLGIIKQKALFSAIDGQHEATIENDRISLKMQDVSNIIQLEDAVLLDTGSPHYVTFNEEIETLNVKDQGAKIRYSQAYKEKGVNVNFVKQIEDNRFKVRTYERGVEDETLSCGTGATAVALAMYNLKKTDKNSVGLNVEGGKLEVDFKPTESGYTDIWLKGPTVQVFKGQAEW